MCPCRAEQLYLCSLELPICVPRDPSACTLAFVLHCLRSLSYIFLVHRASTPFIDLIDDSDLEK